MFFLSPPLTPSLLPLFLSRSVFLRVVCPTPVVRPNPRVRKCPCLVPVTEGRWPRVRHGLKDETGNVSERVSREFL